MQRHMNANKGVVFVLAFVFLANAWPADKEEPTSPEALISRARSQEDIWTDGTPPILMRAELQLFDAKGSPVHGDYSLDWVSPSKWREEIRFGQYERLRLGDAKGYWQTTGLSYQPQIIFQLDTLLHIKKALKVMSKQSLGKVKDREKSGLRQKCTEVKWTKATERIMCFDDANGALVRVDYPKDENQNPPEISRIEYSGFNPVGGKLVPYEIRALRDGKVIVAVKVLEITKTTEENPAHFTIPVNAEFWAQCDDLQEAEPLDRIQPVYPPSARANHEQGRVLLYAVQEADGSLSHLTIIQRAAPDLEAAALEAVRHWHYKPATCGQTPIRMEIQIFVDFSLRY
jgi:TonB family protein